MIIYPSGSAIIWSLFAVHCIISVWNTATLHKFHKNVIKMTTNEIYEKVSSDSEIELVQKEAKRTIAEGKDSIETLNHYFGEKNTNIIMTVVFFSLDFFMFYYIVKLFKK